MNKFNIPNDVLEKGKNKLDGVSSGEAEDWDKITLCSETGTPINGTPRKTWKKRSH
jgi:hypothetical protein